MQLTSRRYLYVLAVEFNAATKAAARRPALHHKRGRQHHHADGLIRVLARDRQQSRGDELRPLLTLHERDAELSRSIAATPASLWCRPSSRSRDLANCTVNTVFLREAVSNSVSREGLGNCRRLDDGPWGKLNVNQ
jgi:hypothetical protein